MTINDGGPAFPIDANNSLDRCIYTGMTLRDWFAGQALTQTAVDHEPDSAARLAYDYADAMIAAREVKPRNGNRSRPCHQALGCWCVMQMDG